MRQLSKTRSIVYHLYPGIIITACFAVLTPLLINYQLPPQFSILVAIAIVAIPLLLIHLNKVKRKENKNRLGEINGYQQRLGSGRLILYIIVLVIFMFFIWGITQPLNTVITQKLLSWLPPWYTVQDFAGYDKQAIIITLLLNLALNGFLAPIVEEYYFRGYLLPRMATWGKWAFVINAILFSFYHFWQPYVYLTLLIALLPLSWAVWKTKDLRLAIYTHCAVNVIGALASFGLLTK